MEVKRNEKVDQLVVVVPTFPQLQSLLYVI